MITSLIGRWCCCGSCTNLKATSLPSLCQPMIFQPMSAQMIFGCLSMAYQRRHLTNLAHFILTQPPRLSSAVSKPLVRLNNSRANWRLLGCIIFPLFLWKTGRILVLFSKPIWHWLVKKRKAVARTTTFCCFLLKKVTSTLLPISKRQNLRAVVSWECWQHACLSWMKWHVSPPANRSISNKSSKSLGLINALVKIISKQVGDLVASHYR